MFAEETKATEEVELLFEKKSPCLKWPVFYHLLEVDLSRAERYRSFVSVLLLRLNATAAKGGKRPAKVTSAHARFIRSRLRNTDYLSRPDPSTLAVVLLNSRREHTSRVAKRLHSDFSLYLRSRRKGGRVLASSSVFPTEVSTARDLCDTAFRRLSSSLGADS